jgi:hypothetical protein
VGFPSLALFQVETKTIADFSSVLNAIDRQGLGFKDARAQSAFVSLVQKMAKPAKAAADLSEVTLDKLEIYILARIYEFQNNGELARFALSPAQVDAIHAMAAFVDQSMSDETDGDELVKASELREFLYCQRAWFLNRQGFHVSKRAEVEMQAGTLFHERRADEAKLALEARNALERELAAAAQPSASPQQRAAAQQKAAEVGQALHAAGMSFGEQRVPVAVDEHGGPSLPRLILTLSLIALAIFVLYRALVH